MTESYKLRSEYISRYLRKLKRNLICPRRYKNEFIMQIKNGFEEFIANNPQSTEIQLEIHFGKPEQVALDFIDSLDKDQILREIDRSKFIKRTVISCAALLILIAITTSIGIYLWNQSNTPQYIYEYKSEGSLENNIE